MDQGRGQVSGNTALVGAHHNNCPAGRNNGAAYLFRCLPRGTCADVVTFLEPAAGTVDARQPNAPKNPSAQLGIDTIKVQGTPGTEVLGCWSLREIDDGGSPNAITGIDDHGDGTFTLHLARPITPGSITTVSATLDDGSVVSAQYTSHPGNVNGDISADENDVLLLLDSLSGTVSPPLDQFNSDIDHSGQSSPADILRLIDLLNGADGYNSWLGTTRPDCGMCCSP